MTALNTSQLRGGINTAYEDIYEKGTNRVSVRFPGIIRQQHPVPKIKVKKPVNLPLSTNIQLEASYKVKDSSGHASVTLDTEPSRNSVIFPVHQQNVPRGRLSGDLDERDAGEVAGRGALGKALAGALGRRLGLDLGLARLAEGGELVGSLAGAEVEVLDGELVVSLDELVGDDLAIGLYAFVSTYYSVVTEYEKW